ELVVGVIFDAVARLDGARVDAAERVGVGAIFDLDGLGQHQRAGRGGGGVWRSKRAARARGDLFRGGEVFLHQHGRHRQHVADVVEALARVVDGEVLVGAEVHAKQVADGVGVFGAVQASQRDAARVGTG